MPSFSPSETYTTYNSCGLPTEADEFNFGPSLVRKTLVTYNTALNSDEIYDHPSEVKVENSSSTPVADSTYSYDSYGNLTGTTLSTGGTPSTISRSLTYAGSGWGGVVSASTDFNSNSTSYSSFTCPLSAFPTSISLPASLSISLSWNCNVALPSSITDPNSNQTTLSYDSMVRQTDVSYPDTGSVSTPSPTSTTQRNVNTAVTGSLTKQEQFDLDGLGRTTTYALVNDPDGETYVATTYDAAGRVASVSNPYRGSPTGGDSYTYDALSRVTRVTHADSSYSQTAYGTNSQNCSSSTYGYGYSTLYTDEVGNQRQIFTDALGRVIEADEPTASSNSLTVYTCYKYDALNDLTEVDQGSETRTYAYDMLGRLTQSTTPEGGGSSKYFYYSTSGGGLCSGNPSAVCRRTDERGIITTYTYDALNRPTGMTYSNSDPSVTYSYDQSSYNGLTIANGKGRRTGMSDGSGETAWSFDSMGRTVAEERTISSLTESLGYTYNLDGSLASATYPSGRKITYTPSAVGRTLSAVDTANSINYVTNATYAPNGGLTGADYGSSITYTGSFDTHRMWPTLFQGSAGSTFFELEPTYNYNGTVSGVTNALTSGRTQSYSYDYLNQIVSGQSSATSGTYCWGQSIPTNGTGYDRYGNLLTINSSQCSAPTLSLSVNTYNQVTNSGYTYDASGNMTHDASYSYAWNAENELKSFAGSYNYTYDGDHKRVENSYNGYYYWFSPDGLPLSETNSGGTVQNEYIYFNGARTARRDSSGNVYYYFSDQIGSTNLMTNSSGTVCFDADYVLFGSMMPPYTSSCSQDYNFAGMELDGGTGNYHTWFRQYEPNLGRWMSPDPLGLGAADPANPQSFNLYEYVLNAPTTLSDPVGLGPHDPCDSRPNSVACGNDVGPREVPPGIFAPGLDEFDWAQLGLLPGTALPSGICPAQFASCVMTPGGLIGFNNAGIGTPFGFDQETGAVVTQAINGVVFINQSFFTNLNNGYGNLLGALGKVFRGRPPGQSFGACVGQNMSLTFTGSPNHPISTTATSGGVGIAGLLGSVTTGGVQLAARLAIGAKVFLSAVPEDEAAYQAFVEGAAVAGFVASDVAIGAAAIGLAPLVGSAANCASAGVAP